MYLIVTLYKIEKKNIFWKFKPHVWYIKDHEMGWFSNSLIFFPKTIVILFFCSNAQRGLRPKNTHQQISLGKETPIAFG